MFSDTIDSITLLAVVDRMALSVRFRVASKLNISLVLRSSFPTLLSVRPQLVVIVPSFNAGQALGQLISSQPSQGTITYHFCC